ncbi:MAG: M50 family metallopeptidase [Acidimicrobiia bacterium]|nr:M50 family metallopeptidase [Acidimicrobiia bacterium]MBT8214541.1 M50 family metallopeptidase [Acidimicrobiia bacterium]NNF68729.1 site-2 protease family protein [Acidimicrobiia bacterium]NNK90803.1 site-2 protease family protein [Acidimicrobiia bacterium]
MSEFLSGIAAVGAVILVVVIHEFGHFVAAKAFGMKATEAFFGFGPRIWSTQRGETEYGVKAFPLGGYVRVVGMNPLEEIDPLEEHRTYRAAPFWKKSVVVLAGVASHFVIAFLILYTVFAFVGTPDPDLPTTQVSAVTQEIGSGADAITTPAALAGIEAGDRLVEFAGVPITEWDDFRDAARARPGETVTVVYERDGTLISTDVELATTTQDGEPIGFFGVSPDFDTTTSGVFGSVVEAGKETGELTLRSFEGLGGLVVGVWDVFTSLFTGESTAIEENRPVSLIGIAAIGQQTAEVGWWLYLELIAWVTIFLGVINVIPLYPLDGGHFALALYEKVVGRTADVRKLVPVAAAVILFMVVIGVLGLYLDIVDPIQLQ